MTSMTSLQYNTVQQEKWKSMLWFLKFNIWIHPEYKTDKWYLYYILPLSFIGHWRILLWYRYIRRCGVIANKATFYNRTIQQYAYNYNDFRCWYGFLCFFKWNKKIKTTVHFAAILLHQVHLSEQKFLDSFWQDPKPSWIFQ